MQLHVDLVTSFSTYMLLQEAIISQFIIKRTKFPSYLEIKYLEFNTSICNKRDVAAEPACQDRNLRSSGEARIPG